MRQRVDLDKEMNPDAVTLLQLNDPVKDRFPVLVAGEVVVGNEEGCDALSVVCPDQLFDIVSVAPAGLAALNIDDRAKGALEGATAARHRRTRACRHTCGQWIRAKAAEPASADLEDRA